MKRAALSAIAAVAIAIVSFVGGYWYRHTHPAVHAEIEDYAVSNVLHQLEYAYYLNKADTEALRDLIDINLYSHLARVIRYQGAITDEEFLAKRTRILNDVANQWDERPPTIGPEEMKKQNHDLVKSAREKCIADPSLKCRARNKPVEQGGVSETRPK